MVKTDTDKVKDTSINMTQNGAAMNSSRNGQHKTSESKQSGDKGEEVKVIHDKWRRRYLRHLRDAGLQLEEVISQLYL